MHTYTFSKRSVFEKIRFGVSTRIVRQSGDPVHTNVDWSWETCLHLKITASVYGLASSSSRTFFCLFPLLASVILLYCFTCLCPVEEVYVVCESWRQVIKERLQRQNETQTKDEAKWNKNKTPLLGLRRRQDRVASEDNSNHPPFCFRRQLPSKQKEMSCCRFRQRDCKCTWSNIHRLGTPVLIALETVAEKIRIPCSHAKKIRIRNLRFRKIHFRERFRKAPFCGPSVFKKLRIRADTCDRFYVSGVEKLRFRKDPGTCARSLNLVNVMMRKARRRTYTTALQRGMSVKVLWLTAFEECVYLGSWAGLARKTTCR